VSSLPSEAARAVCFPPVFDLFDVFSNGSLRPASFYHVQAASSHSRLSSKQAQISAQKSLDASRGYVNAFGLSRTPRESSALPAETGEASAYAEMKAGAVTR